MTLHAFKKYIQYSWVAKSRHGVHSPFVYDFIEYALNKQRRKPLQERIATYFGKKNMVQLEGKPGDCQKNFQQLLTTIQSEDIIIVPSIHKTESSSLEWELLCNNSNVKLSIDLYSVGLLFFKKEFKEKQHFVLKA